MREQATTTLSRTKHKSFTYHTALHWIENRSGALHAAGKPELRVSSPPEFKGEAGIWTPEDLFVAAVEACTMTTFIAFAQKLSLPLIAYHSSAEGVLEFSEGGYRFTRVILRPTVVVASQECVARAEKVMYEAHHACLIANSMRAEVLIEPVFQAMDLAPGQKCEEIDVSVSRSIWKASQR